MAQDLSSLSGIVGTISSSTAQPAAASGGGGTSALIVIICVIIGIAIVGVVGAFIWFNYSEKKKCEQKRNTDLVCCVC